MTKHPYEQRRKHLIDALLVFVDTRDTARAVMGYEDYRARCRDAAGDLVDLILQASDK